MPHDIRSHRRATRQPRRLRGERTRGRLDRGPVESWQSNGSSLRSASRGHAVKSRSANLRAARLTCRSRMVNEDCSSTRCSPRSKQARDKLSQRKSISRALMHRDAAKLWQAFRLSTRVPEALSSTRIGIEPAISCSRSSAGPRRCSRSSDDTDSRARSGRQVATSSLPVAHIRLGGH